MWARIMGNQLVEIISHPKPMTINNVQYPKSIFTRAWTHEERKAIGIVPYEYEGSGINNMFYTSSESAPAVKDDKVVVTRTQTDWIVIREQDNGTAKPADLAKWRTDLRAKAAALETSIDSKSDVAGLEAMTIATQEMIDKEEDAEFYDWPVNPRESAI